MGSSRAHIRFLAVNRGATTWYRANVPGRALAAMGHEVALDLWGTRAAVPAIDGLGPGDVMVVVLPQAPEALAAIRGAKTQGVLAVADIDDDPWNLSADSPRQGRFTPAMRKSLETSLTEADLVTTPSAHLAAELERFGTRVEVLPNCLIGADWPSSGSRASRAGRRSGAGGAAGGKGGGRSAGGPVIGWAGGDTHGADLAMVASALARVAADRPAVRFAATGLGAPPWPELADRTEVVPYRPVHELPALLSRFDVAIAPLLDDAFNRSKSDLKFLEYAAAGLPSVCSRVGPYVESVQDGVTGLLADGEDQWVEALESLLDDPARARRLGTAARRWAEGRFIERNAGRWTEAYGL